MHKNSISFRLILPFLALAAVNLANAQTYCGLQLVGCSGTKDNKSTSPQWDSVSTVFFIALRESTYNVKVDSRLGRCYLDLDKDAQGHCYQPVANIPISLTLTDKDTDAQSISGDLNVDLTVVWKFLTPCAGFKLKGEKTHTYETTTEGKVGPIEVPCGYRQIIYLRTDITTTHEQYMGQPSNLFGARRDRVITNKSIVASPLMYANDTFHPCSWDVVPGAKCPEIKPCDETSEDPIPGPIF